MTHQVLNPDTNTFTPDPDEVARQIVRPSTSRTGDSAPVPEIVIAVFDDDPYASDEETQLIRDHWLYLHPAQALAVANRLVELAHQARNVEQWIKDIEQRAREFGDDTADRSHLARAHEGSPDA